MELVASVSNVVYLTIPAGSGSSVWWWGAPTTSFYDMRTYLNIRKDSYSSCEESNQRNVDNTDSKGLWGCGDEGGTTSRDNLNLIDE